MATSRRWRKHIKQVEFGVAFGMAVFIGWNFVSLVLLTVLGDLGLEPGLLANVLASVCYGFGLVVCMGLAGLLAGLMLVSGRWVFSITAALLAVLFQAAILLISADPAPLWRSVEALVATLAMLAVAIVLSAWAFAWIQRLTSRKSDAPPKAPDDPSPPGGDESGQKASI